jgi:protein phosphatase
MLISATGIWMRTRQECVLTHTGNVRTNNEDNFYSDPKKGIWIVADGMGGHEAGEVASQIVIDTLRDKLNQGKTVSEAIQLAHHAILAGAQNGNGARGMGSTVVVLKAEAQRYSISWVGDSRAYIWARTSENKGILKRLTTDHSYVQMLVQSGAITAKEAETHPDKNVITQCLGSLELDVVKVDTVEGVWANNQWIILCSDGLSDELEDKLITAILGNNNNLESAGNALLQQTLNSGGRDNTTIILVGQPTEPQSVWQTVKAWFS